MKKKLFFCLFAASCIFIFTNCTYVFSPSVKKHNIKDISRTITFNEIKNLGYMGGVLVYNPSDESIGQLADNVSVAFRLGKLEKKIKDGEEVFTDISDFAKFGKIYIKKIDKDKIIFDSILYDAEGKYIQEKTSQILNGCEIDIDNDGVMDLKYSKPTRKHVGYEDSIYLTFLSSPDFLTTSMYSILLEQYENNEYPGGVVGINPDEKFIIAKYNQSNISRAIVSSATSGDYLFDRTTGEYFEIKTGSLISGRSVVDNEIELQNNENIDFKYKVSDFLHGYSPYTLAEKLGLSIEEKDIHAVVNSLNEKLKDKKLVETVYSQENAEIEDELKEMISLVDSFTYEELISFNRMFIDEHFSLYSPQVASPSCDVTDVLPLYSCVISGTEEKDESTVECSRELILAPSEYEDYEVYKEKKKNVDKQYDKFTHIKVYSNDKLVTLDSLVENVGLKVAVSTVDIGLGISGSFNISFSNVDISFKTAVYFSIETKANLKKNLYERSLLPDGPIKFFDYKWPLQIGPVTLMISCPGTFDIPLEVQLNGQISSNEHMAFTGLYGGGFNIGADYGLKWKKWFKIWRKWIYKPAPYFNGYSSGLSIKETAYYIGKIDKEEDEKSFFLDKGTVSCSIKPNVKIESSVSWTILKGGVGINVGVEHNTSLTLENIGKENPEVHGKMFIDVFEKIYCFAGITLDIPIVGEKTYRIDKEFTPVSGSKRLVSCSF